MTITAHTRLIGRLRSCGLALVSAALASGAAAQVPPGPTPPTREEIRRPPPGQAQEQIDPALTVDAGFQRERCPLADPQFADIRFTLKEAVFAGGEKLDPALLAPAWSSLAGQEIAIAEVCDIRDRAAAILREKGYVATVQVPAQTIDTGEVKFNVVLARLTGLVVRGDAGASAPLLERYLQKLRDQPLFRRDEAERYLLLARDIPGLGVRLSLTRDTRPSAQPGDLVGIVDVVHRSIEGDASVLNWNSDATGRFGGSARVQFNGLTGMGDLTELVAYSAIDPSEQIVLQARHEFGIGGDGLRLGASLIHAWTKPDVPGPDVFEAKTFIASIYGAYPIVRSQGKNLAIRGGFEWIDQDLEFSNLPLSEDELRVAFVRLEGGFMDRGSIQGHGGYSMVEPRFAGFGTLEVRQGFGIFGASEPCGTGFVNCIGPGIVPLARLNGDPTAFILRGEGQIDFRPDPLIKFTLKPRFQYSPDPLLSYEQFSGGNFTSGRGYDPGAVVGDSGLGLQVEAAYGSLQPKTPGGVAWQPFVFWDTLAAWTNNVGGDPVTLNSVGAGVRFNIARRAFLEVTGAIPLERTPLQAQRGDVRLLVNLAVRFGE